MRLIADLSAILLATLSGVEDLCSSILVVLVASRQHDGKAGVHLPTQLARVSSAGLAHCQACICKLGSCPSSWSSVMVNSLMLLHPHQHPSLLTA